MQLSTSIVRNWKSPGRLVTGMMLVSVVVLNAGWCLGQDAAVPPLDLVPPPLLADDLAVGVPSVITGTVFAGTPVAGQPLWTRYALTDALFWGRDNQSSDRPLIVGGGKPYDVRLSTQD